MAWSLSGLNTHPQSNPVLPALNVPGTIGSGVQTATLQGVVVLYERAKLDRKKENYYLVSSRL